MIHLLEDASNLIDRFAFLTPDFCPVCVLHGPKRASWQSCLGHYLYPLPVPSALSPPVRHNHSPLCGSRDIAEARCVAQ